MQKQNTRHEINNNDKVVHGYTRTEPIEESEEEDKVENRNKQVKYMNIGSNNTSKNNSLTKPRNNLNQMMTKSYSKERVLLNDSHLKSELSINTNTNTNSNTNKNIQIPYEYLTDIFQSLHFEEVTIKCIPYMEKQKDINEKMRAVVINWVIEVHNRFKLYPETLFLSVNIFDRYLNRKIMKRNRLQLLGVVCLLIACKYEEIFSPEIRDFVCILDKSFEKEDILSMEKEVLTVLKFSVTVATSLKFYEILCIKINTSKIDFFFGKYLLELSLLNHKFLNYHPSLVASSALYIALILYKKETEKKKTQKIFFSLVNYKQEELIDCSIDLCFMYENADSMTYQAAKKKFMSKQFMEVAKLKFNNE